MPRRFLCLLSFALLASCSAGAASSSAESSSIEGASISAQESSGESLPGSSIEDSSVGEVSSSNEESSDSKEASLDPEAAIWTLSGADLPKNPSQGKHHDLPFSVNAQDGSTVSFLGDDILKGGGSKGGVSIDDTIQLTKQTGYFYMTAGMAVHLEFDVVRIIETYGGLDHDYTGVPSLYSGDEMDASNGERVELTCLIDEANQKVHYSCDLPYARFRIQNDSGYALYIQEVRSSLS